MWSEIKPIVNDPSRRVFAIVDGALFDDLPSTLKLAGIAHRSLYLSVQDAELIRAGPWLIDPYHRPDPDLNVWGGIPAVSAIEGPVAADTQDALVSMEQSRSKSASSFHQNGGPADPVAQLQRLMELTGGSAALVIWIGGEDVGEASLWRHLRTLNMVLIPRQFLPDGPSRAAAAANDDDGLTHEAVLFRHFDGNVLAEVLPVMDAAQFSRFFGPANALMFYSPDHPASNGSHTRRAVLPDDVPPAVPGLLRLSDQQMRGIESARLDRASRRIANYLREAAPLQTQSFSDRELTLRAKQWATDARLHGVSSEAALGRWSYLELISGGAVGKSSEVKKLFAVPDASVSPDKRVQLLMQATIEQVRVAKT
jgi:hypothetical protein